MTDVVVKTGVVDVAMDIFRNEQLSLNVRKGLLAMLLDEPETFEKYIVGKKNTEEYLMANFNITSLEARLIENNHKIDAIREIRSRTGLGLHPAKLLADKYQESISVN